MQRTGADKLPCVQQAIQLVSGGECVYNQVFQDNDV